MSNKKRREIPRFSYPIFETHCHLDYLDEALLEQTLEQAIAVGIDKILTIAVSAQNLDTVAALTANPMIWGTQGIHPHEAADYNSGVEEKIRNNTASDRIVAVGEIGLDYYYDHADRATQRKVFESQLALAVELGLPVVVHTRDAESDTEAILRDFCGQLHRGGVIHSFTSSVALAESCLDMGFCLGFNGIITFNNAENVRDVVRATPLENILLETDSPYLTPAPYRGRRNAPYYLPFVAEKVAELKGIDPESLLPTVYQNSEKLFFAR